MKYTKLGCSGVVVSKIALGTMYFGDETSEGDAFAILDAFVEAGGNLIDTANVYAGGKSELVIGHWLASRPNDITDCVVLATKGRTATWARRQRGRALPAQSAPRPQRVLAQPRRRDRGPLSVSRLGHADADGGDAGVSGRRRSRRQNPLCRPLEFHRVGSSAFCLSSSARGDGVQPPVTLQPQYSLLPREIEWEIVPAALHNGLGLLPWSPLAGGFLTGKYRRGLRPARIPERDPRRRSTNRRPRNMPTLIATGRQSTPSCA